LDSPDTVNTRRASRGIDGSSSEATNGGVSNGVPGGGDSVSSSLNESQVLNCSGKRDKSEGRSSGSTSRAKRAIASSGLSYDVIVSSQEEGRLHEVSHSDGASSKVEVGRRKGLSAVSVLVKRNLSRASAVAGGDADVVSVNGAAVVNRLSPGEDSIALSLSHNELRTVRGKDSDK